MKKLNAINLPVMGAALALCLAACGSDGSSVAGAPEEMCWDEAVPFGDAAIIDLETASAYSIAHECSSNCRDSLVVVRRCVTGVEFK